MPPSDAVVVRTAQTPAQAQIFVALLQSEGIPAFVEGGSLTDEYAASRRLMNLMGVRVMVPASERERALEVLTGAEVPADELEAQALAAAPEVTAASAGPRAAPAPAKASMLWPLLALGGLVLAVVFFGLWQDAHDRFQRTFGWYDDAAKKGQEHSPLIEEPMADGIRTRLRRDGRLYRESFDRNHDGFYEEHRTYGPDGEPREVLRDLDNDGVFEDAEVFHDGLRLQMHSSHGDDQFDSFTLFDKDGKELKQQRWSGAAGWQDAPQKR